jgi:hypothetical protein
MGLSSGNMCMEQRDDWLIATADTDFLKPKQATQHFTHLFIDHASPPLAKNLS